MDNLDLVIQLISLIVGSGFLGYCGNWLHKHHRANRTANALELAQKITKWSVARVANDSNLAMGQRRTAVVREVQAILNRHGYHVNVRTIVGLAEMTYQLYKKAGHNIVEPKPTPVPTEDNTTDGPQGNIIAHNNGKAEYAPSKSELSNDELKVLNDYRRKKVATA